MTIRASTGLVVALGLAACASTSRGTQRLDSYRLASDGVTIEATVTVTQCDDVKGLEIVTEDDEVVLAAIVESTSRDCDSMGIVVVVVGTLPEPLGDRSLVSRQLPQDR